ncbi:probable cytochrome P450 9f2 isoform X1 [Ochlerotatus camptorhynchus]|uniref:probable cytochrome P450 9f2 isoform X1 n=1 Tax=Ochlerotatus camptorhynchus TaxID=644619 RepID=UPI0031D0125B
MVNLFAAVAVGVIVLLLYHYVAKKYQYFLTKPIPCIKPTFLLGIYDQVFFKKVKLVFGSKVLYNSFPDAKIIGYYTVMEPTYMVRDPEMIKKITIKDFDHFTDRSPVLPSAYGESTTEDSLFFNSLFSLRGQKWRDMRSTLSPAFTGSRIRQMFELVSDRAISMMDFFHLEASSGRRKLELEMKDTFSRFVSNAIATVAFGIEVDSFRDPENEFYIKGKQTQNVHTFKAIVLSFAIRLLPFLQKVVRVDLVDADLAEYFKKTILDNMEQRRARGIVRNDMVNMLMGAQTGALKHEKDEQEAKEADGFATVEESNVGKSTHSRIWTENELVAQCFLFFFAAFDNISSILTFLSYELTVDQEIQKRLYEEIEQTEASLGGKPLTYDALQKMKFMDMVVSETLRKWPTATLTDRHSNEDYVFDDEAGIKFVIEKGNTLWIPILAIHHDPKYYPCPERFDPERFSEENRSRITPGTYLPFGAGPRNCIGPRLALMEIKMAMYYLLQDFRLEPSDRTQIPLQLSKSAFTLQPEKGVWLELTSRK